jgi:hypothetical protein
VIGGYQLWVASGKQRKKKRKKEKRTRKKGE